jgi:hypothetical protein
LLEVLVREIKFTLEEEGVPKERLRAAVHSLSFRVATIIDASRVMEIDGKRLYPCLTFGDDYSGIERVGDQGPTWMHDFVNDIVEKVFAGESVA